VVASAATAPHLIMTYCALLALAVLRDDYALLNRAALKCMVGACQDADGGYVRSSSIPSSITIIIIILATSIRLMAVPDSRRCRERATPICA